jgi:hypothetical protein
MLAVSYGAEKILTQLIEMGVNVSLTDNYGNNALRLLLAQCFIDASFKKQLNRFYYFLKNESLKVKIGTRFFKIESHQAEFLMLNFMLASMKNLLLFNQNEKLTEKDIRGHFESIDFVDIFEGLNQQVLPEYRAKRTYISSILAKNEVFSDNKYNKLLFVRIANGKYIINPQMELMIEEKWVNFYDLIDIALIEEQVNDRIEDIVDKNFSPIISSNPYKNNLLNHFKNKVKDFFDEIKRQRNALV